MSKSIGSPTVSDGASSLKSSKVGSTISEASSKSSNSGDENNGSHDDGDAVITDADNFHNNSNNIHNNEPNQLLSSHKKPNDINISQQILTKNGSESIKGVGATKQKEATPSAWNSADSLSSTVDKSHFRNYIIACDRVKAFYKEQHEKQTFAYNLQARINFKTKVRAKLTIWDALVKLNKLIDESDPDTELSQIDHAIQTAEAIRKDGKPRWMQLVGLIHDLGKLLYFFDAKGQWDVVGDTFPIGCSFSKKIIFNEFFKNNQDSYHPIYKTKYGIYTPHCGLDNVMLSWGHDEYMYHIAKLHSTLPKEGLAMIRYHSCYPIHRENAYEYLMNDDDKQMIEAVKAFNPYDLYSKSPETIDLETLEPYYHELIDEFFPNKIVEF